MILGVNGIRLLGKRTGVGRAIEAVLRCMGELDHPFTQIRVYTPQPLDEEVYLPPEATNVVLPSRLPWGLWEQWTLPHAHGTTDLLFCPSYVSPVRARCPVLLVNHGSYEGYPAAFSWWRRTKARAIYARSARSATAISTVSAHSKRDIVRFYKVDPAKVRIIPEGVDTQVFRPIDDAARLATWRQSVLGRDVPFVMYVGKPTKRRNLPSLIEAFAQLKKQKSLSHQLLLIGVDLHASGLEAAVEKHGLQEHVTTLSHATHAEIALAYNASDLLVYPSSYEGFGMPVLEAMACGTPVIALNNTAFPEFAGGIAHLLPDAAVPTLIEGMDAVLHDDAWCARMAADGPRRAAQYDWMVLTRQYVDLMMECHDGSF